MLRVKDFQAERGRSIAVTGWSSHAAPAPSGRILSDLRRTPRLLLRLVGLAVPAAGEMVEMEYAFADDFVMAQDAWIERFGPQATGWEPALRATLDALPERSRRSGIGSLP